MWSLVPFSLFKVLVLLVEGCGFYFIFPNHKVEHVKQNLKKKEKVSNLINACIFKLWISNYVFTKLDSREILDIFLPITTSKLLNIDWKNIAYTMRMKCMASLALTLVLLITSVSFSPLGNFSSNTHILTSSDYIGEFIK